MAISLLPWLAKILASVPEKGKFASEILSFPFSTGIKCPKCKEGEVVERFSPKSKKKFYACSRYPDCDFISKYEPIDMKCPSCSHYYVEARFKKVDDQWVKYLRCPECKEVFDFPDDKKEE